MKAESDHSACVNAWLERSAKTLPTEPLIALFERGFSAIWKRAHRTLGEVTLTAILDRVMYTAAEQFPMLAALAIEPSGLRCQALRDNASDLDREELAEAVAFVLVEFLTVLGNLTSDILSPALHKELSKVLPEATLRVANEASDQPRPLQRKTHGG